MKKQDLELKTKSTLKGQHEALHNQHRYQFSYPLNPQEIASRFNVVSPFLRINYHLYDYFLTVCAKGNPFGFWRSAQFSFKVVVLLYALDS